MSEKCDCRPHEHTLACFAWITENGETRRDQVCFRTWELCDKHAVDLSTFGVSKD